MANILSPHDKLFKITMGQKEAAIEFLYNYLPKNIREEINLDTLVLQKESFIDERLKSYFADLLYEVNFKKGKGYIYLLFEHLSNPDSLIALRLLKYSVNIIENHINKNKTKVLPIIYPMVIYTGHKKYNCSMSIFDLFADNKKLAEEVFLQPYHLLNLQNISDEQIKDQLWFGMMAKIFKKRFEDGLIIMRSIIENLDILDRKGYSDYINAVVKYIIEFKEIDNKKEFFEEVISNLLPDTGKKIMTLAETLRYEGRTEGRTEGRAEAMEIFVLNLLEESEPIERIVRLTGLSKEEIEKIKRK